MTGFAVGANSLATLLVAVVGCSVLLAVLIAGSEQTIDRWRAELAGFTPVRAILDRIARVRLILASKPDPSSDLMLYLLAAVLTLVLATWAVAAALLYGRTGIGAFDTPVTGFMASNRARPLDGFMVAVTSLGGMPFVPIAALLISLALVRRAKSFTPAVVLIGLILVSQLVKIVLKELIVQAAPDDLPSAAALFSFPSGHVLTAMTMYGGAAFLVARITRSWKVKTWGWTAAVTLTILVATSRLYLGVHTASDVAGGVLIGSILLALAVGGLNAWEDLGRSEPLRLARNRAAGRAFRWGLIVVSLGIVIQVILLALPGIRESAEVMRDVRPVFVVLAVALQVGTNLMLAEMYRQTVAQLGGRLAFRQALNVSMGTFTVSRVIPGGAATAGVFMAQGLGRFGIAPAPAVGTALVGGVVRMAVLGIVVVLGAMLALVGGDLPDGYMAGIPVFIAVVGMVGTLLIKMVRSRSALGRIFSGAQHLVASFGVTVDLSGPRRFVEDAVDLLPPLRRLILPGSWAAAGWVLDAASLWLLFWAFGHPVHPGVVLVGFGVANLINTVPITPGGVGLVEAGLAGAYIAFGVPGSVAVITVLAYRLVSHWLPVAAGVPAYLTGVGRGSSRSVESETEVTS
ncbi:hypothetical protein BH23ACT12_BH23ACT12_10240 [soil metagenome]